jgi:hypothetical protein
MKNNTLLLLDIKVRAPIRSMNQLRRIIKLIILFREKPDTNPMRYPIIRNCCIRL